MKKMGIFTKSIKYMFYLILVDLMLTVPFSMVLEADSYGGIMGSRAAFGISEFVPSYVMELKYQLFIAYLLCIIFSVYMEARNINGNKKFAK